MNPLPPQAYTKDTLLKAYSWLQNQPHNIKEMASTPDVLVSLYLKTTRDGEGALSRPSIQNFKNELKQLAGMMGELEAPVPAPTSSTPSTAFSFQAPPMNESNSLQSQNILKAEFPSSTQKTFLNESSKDLGYQIHLDAKSWFLIQEVKESLNLSSEMEALRAIIKVGSRKIKNLE